MTTSSIVRGCQSCVTAGRTIECWDAGSASFGPPARADWLSEAEAGKGAPGPLMARRPSLLGHMVSEAQFRLRGVHAPAEIKPAQYLGSLHLSRFAISNCADRNASERGAPSRSFL
jgi:hypothetical protein